jgi:hypothetical protein
MSIVSIANQLSTTFPLANTVNDSYDLWLEKLGGKNPVMKLDNGNIYFDSEKEVFIASQWEGVSEEFDTLESAYDWVEAGCT